eukprot:TRINITY_DN8471_c0_g1_i2.p1 TRINITY_DN8471_c0_g1~~TRINITY_DN8471_c0_g1_i2.p1  ORF type:complete len:1107 (-),score=193.48 TRINITY_DN8471_c0_g1_i2:165-3296(-)
MDAAEATTASRDVVVIEKPHTDHREYRHIVLPNALRAIVISDCKCDKAAAALSVKVGSIFDPKEVQGLAHFCEHMLFLGTKKYPQEDEYNSFLSKHGGASNAYTADCVTNYYFGVSPDHLDAALDRFSQFFVSPLFTESATDRELQAVDSEHSKNRQSDVWRMNQLLKNDANPKHPLQHFGTGSSETLKTIPEKDGYPVRQRLLEFHSKYYSANLMCLVVLGKESLEDLEALVRKYFEAVVNKNATVPSGPELGGEEPAYRTDGWPRCVRVIPVKDVRTAKFQFVLPQQSPMRWRTKPTRYLSFLLGHEGKGSILSALKAAGLATELSAGPSMDDAGVCIFAVCVELTEAGEKEVLRVGEFLFAYIRLVQESPVSEALHRENQSISEMNFRYRAVANSVSQASSLSRSMQDDLPVDKVFSGPAKIWEMDASHISEVAGYLTCAHLRMCLVTKAHSLEKDCTESERWYGTRYGSGPLPEEWHKAWEGRRVGDGMDAVAAANELGLALPRANPFVPENLDLKERPSEGVPKHPLRQPLPDSLATLLIDGCEDGAADRVLQVYFRQDDTFDLPKACVNFEFYSPWCYENLQTRTIANAWCNVVQETLNEVSYDAEGAGLFYAISATSQGLSLKFSGYQDKLPALMKTVTEKMSAMDVVSEHTFSLVHSRMLRDAKNTTKTTPPYHQAIEWQLRCLNLTGITAVESLEQVEKLTCEMLNGANRKMLQCCFAEGLVQGNFKSSEVGEVLKALVPALKPETPGAVKPLGMASLSCVEPGRCVLIRRDGANPEEQNGATIVTLQAAEETLANTTLVELASQVLSQRCFDELRTKQQLGYIVALQPYSERRGFCGIRVIVQSERHPAEVHRRIDSWLAAALEVVIDAEKSSDEHLGEYVDALLTLKREKPKKLADEFARNWSEVRNRSFLFSRQEDTISFLERPRQEVLAEFRAFIRDRLIPAPRIATEVLGAAGAALERSCKAAGNTAEATSVAGAANDGMVATDEDEIAKKMAEVKPYEGAAVVIESLADVEAFRKGLTWRFSNTTICE